MNRFVTKAAIVVALAIHADGFTISTSPTTAFLSSSSTPSLGSIAGRRRRSSRSSQLYVSSTDKSKGDQDDEIERLRSMAAKLRADAAALEAEKAQQLAEASEKAFRQFDTNKDGEISVAELKEGLEKVLKTELSDKRVQELMKEFDASGDGALQLDEFVGVDIFRNKLELLAQEEKRLALEAKEKAKREEVEAALALAKVEILNEKEPTNSDKVLSVLPYLFPLMDGLQWGRFLLGAEGAESNPFVVGLALLYALYRAIPFSGFIAFFVLYFLTGNPSINRLVRYNMQQAIFLDVALFFPGLIGGLVALTGLQMPLIVSQISNDAIFITLLGVIGYCTVSSLLGIAPNKIPLISKAVEDRMPNVEMFDLDTDGNIVFRPREEEEEAEKKDDKDKK
mmetsp:Transcript_15701/g.19929  ORF Transcript_15701/g.19929 Transcript_15701/m.19929 type:complete len:396 (-) Transcript_15701:31-1218(-)